ncbi:aromatic amino acid aminotransferase 1 [Emericellopsis atlantica]|uniref:Aromatic amino acid aminotransferase 1 n=1 Tax=Emericellopsis atlantica TaxID=2614577 RepID=A0A9P7ZPC5_9HYPO|nr:aromatic amino acid aminotransferase 1 [Emericellopsis atlantica]KAG9255362.1 aromatic amino acid aminotransferase 1 [Emericellopsis atlantica]
MTPHSEPLAPPRDLSHHFTRATKNRQASAIKMFYKFFQIPGIGNLAGGLPNVSLFPFDTLEAQIAKPERWDPTPNEPGPPSASHITVPKTNSEADPLKKIDLSTGLQYGTAEGYPPLRSFIRQFTRNHLHPHVPYLNGPEVILTCGSTDGFHKTIEMLMEPWLPDRDPVEARPGMLCEVFVYMNAPDTARPKGAQMVPVEVDAEGMLVHGKGGLQDVLENWDPRNGARPRLMYSVTMGHNPTGGVLSVKRRKDIYKLCCEYDVIIVEDDPYWYLQYPSAAEEEAKSRELPFSIREHYKPTKSSGYEFLDSLVPSFLSMDVQGRVIRLDTFSKTIAPGCRLGWITAQPAFIERLLRITETTTQQPSGFVQTMVAEAIMGPQPPAATRSFLSLSRSEQQSFEGWQTDGWVRWLSGLRGVYERRMNTMASLLDEHAYQLKQSTPVADQDAEWGVISKTKLMSFDWPRGGMFIWLQMHFESHPLFNARGTTYPVLDGPLMSKALMVHLTKAPYKVLAAPGTIFCANESILAERGWRFFRLCFAAEEDEAVGPSARRFGEGVQRFWRIKKVETIEKLVDELD